MGGSLWIMPWDVPISWQRETRKYQLSKSSYVFSWNMASVRPAYFALAKLGHMHGWVGAGYTARHIVTERNVQSSYRARVGKYLGTELQLPQGLKSLDSSLSSYSSVDTGLPHLWIFLNLMAKT